VQARGPDGPNASHNLTSTRSFDPPFFFLLRRAATCPLNSPSFVATFPLRLCWRHTLSRGGRWKRKLQWSRSYGCSGIAGYLFCSPDISEIENLGHDALLLLGVRPRVHYCDSLEDLFSGKRVVRQPRVERGPGCARLWRAAGAIMPPLPNILGGGRNFRVPKGCNGCVTRRVTGEMVLHGSGCVC